MDHDSRRTVILAGLGFGSYADYLDSEFWTGIKQRVFEYYGSSCRLCDASATEVYQSGYSRAVLSGTVLKSGVPLCSRCYLSVVFSRAGVFRKIRDAQSAYCRLWGAVKRRKKKDPVARRGLFGYCRNCGCRARKGSLVCRPCAQRTPHVDPAPSRRPAALFVNYQLRDVYLRQLGFADYREYLTSPLWSRIRKLAYVSYAGRCHLCKAPASNIHHLSYDLSVLKDFDRNYLVALCGNCHNRVEFDGDVKRSYLGALREFLVMESVAGYARFEPSELCGECGILPLDGRKKVCIACHIGSRADGLLGTRRDQP